MTWPLFLILIVMLIALFFVLSVGMPRFFAWFRNLFLHNSMVRSYGKLPTFRSRRSRFFIIIFFVFFSAFASQSKALAAGPCLFYGNIFDNYSNCDFVQFQQSEPTYSIPTTTFTYFNPSSTSTVQTAIAQINELNQNFRVVIGLGMVLAVLMFIDLVRRVVLPRTW